MNNNFRRAFVLLGVCLLLVVILVMFGMTKSIEMKKNSADIQGNGMNFSDGDRNIFFRSDFNIGKTVGPRPFIFVSAKFYEKVDCSSIANIRTPEIGYCFVLKEENK